MPAHKVWATVESIPLCTFRRLLSLLCTRLDRLDIQDIGAAVPAAAQACLAKAGWRPDKLESVAMVLPADSYLREQAGAPLPWLQRSSGDTGTEQQPQSSRTQAARAGA